MDRVLEALCLTFGLATALLTGPGCGRVIELSGDGAQDPPATDSSEGPEPDLPADLPPDLPIPEGACPRIDFLFVIDDSGSMETYQANLIANFPRFVEGIENTLDYVDDYHVGVITTDAYAFNVDGCRHALSALVVATDSGTCGPYATGHNFMTRADDLSLAFGCAAKVGVDGDAYERPMAALVEAIQDPLGDPGLCNEGFLRDDSLLVVVILTDEADGKYPVLDPEADYPGTTSPGGPAVWFDAIVDARGGDESRIVVVSLLHYAPGPCPPPTEFHDGVNIGEFTVKFTHGFFGGICEPDYGPIFDQAVEVVRTACEEYGEDGE